MNRIIGFVVLTTVTVSAMAQPTSDQIAEVEQWQKHKARLSSLTFPPVSGRNGGLDSAFPEPEILIGRNLETDEEMAHPSRGAIDINEILRAPAFTGSLDDISIAPENANERGATPPTPFLYPYSFPWTSHYKLFMEFPSGSTFLCSAASAGSFHLITAGHCIYNHSEGGWATQVRAYPAATDVIIPSSDFDFPYGEALALTLHTYNGWINNQDLNHDFAIMEMNWRVGSRTGWMGRETNTTAASLNYNGYPVEHPYIPASDRYYQHPDFEATNGYATYRINMIAYIYGGHSGGPVWRYDGDRYTQGVNSTSNRVGSATATRITNNKFNDIGQIIADDEANSPPVPRSELVEYVFNSGHKGVAQSEVRPGGLLDVTWNVYNTGVIHSGEIFVYFYLSPSPVLDGSSIFIDSTTLPSGLNANVWTSLTTTISVPSNIQSGNYFVHWWFIPSATEYNGSDNVGLTSDTPVLVDPTVCLPDPWEFDGISSPAYLVGTVPISRTICPGTETDWYEIGLTEPLSGITVVTGGSDPMSDTEFALMTDGGVIVANSYDIFNDYAGLQIDCQSPLESNERIVALYSGDAERIDDYWIDVEIQPCPHFTDIELINAVTQSGSVSGSRPFDDWTFYYLDVGNMPLDVEITLHGLTADADLYVRTMDKPTIRTYACRPFSGGTTREHCEFSITSAQRFYIGVVNWSSGTTSYQITARVSETPLLEDGFDVKQ